MLTIIISCIDDDNKIIIKFDEDVDHIFIKRYFF
jgi:hypothetical protein